MDRSRLFSLCGLLLLASLLVSVGCGDFSAACDRKIKHSTRALETAPNDAQRAKAYSSRGAAYSDKARFGRVTHSIRSDEYERLFDLAIKDHNQALALNPASAEVYFNRAQAYYDRGGVDLAENKAGSKAWFDLAALDFEQVLRKEPKNELALDLLGLTYEQGREPDKAIQAYTREMALNRLGKQRLADAYCNFGFEHQQQKEFAAAAAAYQKSVEFGVAGDKSCPYDPFASMIAIYTTETREYDKAWNAVYRALKAGHGVAPELILQLKRESGRAE